MCELLLLSIKKLILYNVLMHINAKELESKISIPFNTWKS